MAQLSDAQRPIKQLASFPEYESYDAFVESKFDDEDFEVHPYELDALSYSLRTSTVKIRKRLADDGFSFARRQSGACRGVHSNDHDRWVNSGTHGGSGFSKDGNINIG